MFRTTLYLPESTHIRLKQASKRQKKSISKLVIDILDKALARQETANLERIYDAFEQLEGIGGKGTKNASTFSILGPHKNLKLSVVFGVTTLLFRAKKMICVQLPQQVFAFDISGICMKQSLHETRGATSFQV